VLIWEASAVAQAAIETGVAQLPIDLAEYREQLERRLGKAHEFMRVMVHKAQMHPKRVVFPEGDEDKILRACQILLDEKIAQPILLGDEVKIRRKMEELRLHLSGAEIIDPAKSPWKSQFIEEHFQLRQRKGMTHKESADRAANPTVFGALMVRLGYADALIDGLTKHYPEAIRPALRIIGIRESSRRVAGCYAMITHHGDIYLLADATVNIEPSAEDLAEIAILTAETARRFNIEPRVAMLSFSNFGSTRHPLAEKVAKAAAIVKGREPGLMVDGEMQADTAVAPEIIEQTYPFSSLTGRANVLIFPNLEAGNIAYKLLARVGGADLIGPIIMGLAKPMHVLQRGAGVNDIVNMACIAVVDAQELEKTALAEAREAVSV
jgi:malate dehydrogenase (oxaloacetate-decarboxylating)(NADP+)